MQHSAVRLSRHLNPSKSQLRRLAHYQLREAMNPQPSYRLLDPPPWKREG
jgi:hypothetical protein